LKDGYKMENIILLKIKLFNIIRFMAVIFSINALQSQFIILNFLLA